LKSIRTLSAGQLIGEVAMLTNDTRTASIVTKTKCPCVSFERAEFMKLLYAEPHRSMDIFKIFGKRLSESNKRLAEATSSK
jgi:CRP-like cAMP-binding protein